jgi:ubiquinone/menaquinone biosynthesis C-methylase UbiE
MTLPRKLEPEVMETPEEADDYDAMDHAHVNQVFVDDFLGSVTSNGLMENLRGLGRPLEILDVGTGTAQIPIELCRRFVPCNITAIDLSEAMIEVANRNVDASGLEGRIRVLRVDAKRLPYAEESFDAVISNSIVHHIPQPKSIFAESWRVLSPRGLLFLRDLLRPDSIKSLDHLVATYAGDANERQSQMFRDSLHASLTIDEVQDFLTATGLPKTWARQTSDRHWSVTGKRE